MMGPFMSDDIVNMTFFTYCCTGTFSLQESQCISIPWIVFSIHMTHSSVNFIWFHFSVAKNVMTNICSSLEHFVVFAASKH